MNERLLGATEAGRILQKSAESVRAYERKGKLHAIKTARGMRLFRESDVRALAAKQSANGTEQKCEEQKCEEPELAPRLFRNFGR